MHKSKRYYKQVRHFKRRMKERCNLHISEEQVNELVQQIQTNQAICIEKQNCFVSIFAVNFQGRELPVAYDKKRKTLRTVLPFREYYKKLRKIREDRKKNFSSRQFMRSRW